MQKINLNKTNCYNCLFTQNLDVRTGIIDNYTEFDGEPSMSMTPLAAKRVKVEAYFILL